MYYISKSAATSTLVCTIVRDQPTVGLYQYYAFLLDVKLDNSEYIIKCQDVTVNTEVYQHFDITGSTVALPLGQYQYKLYNASGSTDNDILYSTVLERGSIKITE